MPGAVCIVSKAEKSRSDGHRDARGIKGPLMGEASRFWLIT